VGFDVLDVVRKARRGGERIGRCGVGGQKEADQSRIHSPVFFEPAFSCLPSA